MDITQYNTRVVQEPRGMIRVITLVFAILAFATTSGFDTITSFTTACTRFNKTTGATYSPYFKEKFRMSVEYPFKFEDQILKPYYSCANATGGREAQVYPMDFSSSAQFYVATGVLSFLYSTAALVLYIFGSRQYESNPLLAVIDLAATGVLTIFWLAGACAWAAGVSDVRYYTSPSYLYKHLDFCSPNNTAESLNPKGECYESNPGKWTSLNISLIFGFANIFLWAASMWFVFKETQFHRKQMPDQMGAPGGPQPGFGQFGDQMGGQQQMPQQTTHFPQQRQQFGDGY
ncbi:unnamed protein product [Medioppia subpectinata]|uniref:MARVEL domain-containing protein n=1 Tax=Medioppia subpectinata TaxID=1979941 RepID=A0A7R9KCY1_9ACAR|nr:unnamed protein product [Medioppia subpectinata]CAG2100326.1 unnamed protein product [Medioppia subpectinata]